MSGTSPRDYVASSKTGRVKTATGFGVCPLGFFLALVKFSHCTPIPLFWYGNVYSGPLCVGVCVILVFDFLGGYS